MSITSIIIFAEVVCFILIQKNIYIDAFATNPSHKEIIIRERLKQFKSKPKEPGANISSEQVNYSEAYKAPLLSIYYYKPNTDTKAILTAENKTLYDVTYGIDQYSRRKGIVHEKKDQYLLAFGGSFVFGEGVENNETLPSRITHYSKKFQAYNFGSQGAAVNNLIVNFKNKKI